MAKQKVEICKTIDVTGVLDFDNETGYTVTVDDEVYPLNNFLDLIVGYEFNIKSKMEVEV